MKYIQKEKIVSVEIFEAKESAMFDYVNETQVRDSRVMNSVQRDKTYNIPNHVFIKDEKVFNKCNIVITDVNNKSHYVYFDTMHELDCFFSQKFLGINLLSTAK